MLDRDISLCKYTESKIHESYISTEKSVERIKNAKEEGVNITCDVALHNIFLTEDNVNNFDTRYKVLPPLRTKKDNKAIIKGLKNDTIDIITSDHNPFEIETKKIEFDNAEFGVVGLETAFGLIFKNLERHLTITQIIDKISNNPRRILGLEINTIEEGNKANLTIFNLILNGKLKKMNYYQNQKTVHF